LKLDGGVVVSKYKSHVADWITCNKCHLCKKRINVVLLRGSIPCQVLFIGEAPGDSEDVIGSPFIGPAGRLLDHVVRQSLKDSHSYAMTNLVGCIPRDAMNAKGEPPKEAILACRPRLLEVIDLCQPKLIVCVGLLSSKNVPSVSDATKVAITHPAAILRMDVSQQALAIKRCIVTVESAAALYL
jgi:DNA polymerase